MDNPPGEMGDMVFYTTARFDATQSGQLILQSQLPFVDYDLRTEFGRKGGGWLQYGYGFTKEAATDQVQPP
jgi:hypothetical protein